MPLKIKCPNCNKVVAVSEELRGRSVRCPHCKTTFTAQVEPADDEGAAIQTESSAEKRSRSKRDQEEDEPRPRRGRSREVDKALLRDPRDKRQSHGPIVMTLGIISCILPIFGLASCLCFGIGASPAILICGILGIALGLPAWLLAQSDLGTMRRGEMSWGGDSTVKSGWICGIVGTVMGVVSLILGCVLLLMFLGLIASVGIMQK